MKEKYKTCRRITSAQIIHHTEIHIIGKDCIEDTLGRFKVNEYQINVKISSCDAIHMKKCATADKLLVKNRDPEKMTDEQLRKV